MTYRINYGNGQVSDLYNSYDAARASLRAVASNDGSDAYRIQRYDAGTADDPGDWVGIGKAGRLATAAREGI
jgi:hypothetical protein